MGGTVNGVLNGEADGSGADRGLAPHGTPCRRLVAKQTPERSVKGGKADTAATPHDPEQEPVTPASSLSAMAKLNPPHNDATIPLSPKAADGRVVVKDPPDAPLDPTADAAEISALRLLDAAEKARRRF